MYDENLALNVREQFREKGKLGEARGYVPAI